MLTYHCQNGTLISPRHPGGLLMESIMIRNTLADRYAELKQAAEALDAELAHVRAQILALGTEVVEGDAAVVTVGLSERTSVDRKEVAKLLTAEQLASVTRVTQVESLRWKAKLKVAAAA